MRLVVADDSMLLREGLARLLADAGFDVVGKAENAPELLRRVELTRPDVAIVDIKMPPTHTDEGIVAAQEIRRAHPQVGVLVLSQYLESRYAMRLLEEAPDAGRLPAQGARLGHRRARRRAPADRRGRVRHRPDDRLAAREAPARAGPARRADRARARGARPDGRGTLERRHLPGALPQPEDGRGPRAPDLPEARACSSRPTTTAACWPCSRTCAPGCRASPPRPTREVRLAGLLIALKVGALH